MGLLRDVGGLVKLGSHAYSGDNRDPLYVECRNCHFGLKIGTGKTEVHTRRRISCRKILRFLLSFSWLRCKFVAFHVITDTYVCPVCGSTLASLTRDMILA